MQLYSCHLSFKIFVPLCSSVDHCSLPANFSVDQHGKMEIYVSHTHNL